MTLKEKRKMCGLTQTELSRLASVSYGRLIFSETGRTKLTPVEIARIKSVLSERVKEIVVEVA